MSRHATRPIRRQGFTIVELLVVIGIMILIAGLLLPVINNVRIDGRKAECANKLRQLSHGVLLFEQARGRFPGSREAIAKRGPGVGRDKWATWCVSVLPYIDQSPLYDQWDDPQVTIVANPAGPSFVERLVPPLALLRCPADTTLESSDINFGGVPPNGSYVASGGLMPRIGVDPAPYGASPAAYLLAMDRHTGVFHDLIQKPSARVSLDMIYDGAGNTLMLSENMQAQWWFYTGNVDEFGGGAAHRNRLSTMFYFMYAGTNLVSPGQPAPTTGVTAEMRINGMKRSATLRPSTARPSSEHRHGVNVAFCDGSVRWIRENIDYQVYVALITPRDGKAHVPNRRYLLHGDDYLND